MNRIIAFIKHRPQVTFWGIAYFTFFVGYLMYVLYPSPLWNVAIWGPFLGGYWSPASPMAGGVEDLFQPHRPLAGGAKMVRRRFVAPAGDEIGRARIEPGLWGDDSP